MITSGLLVPDTLTEIFQAPYDLVLRFASFTNTGSEDVTIDVYIVKNGDTAGPQNLTFSQIVIPPKDTFILDEDRLIMATGDSIHAQASVADKVSFVASYYPLEA